MYDCDPSDLITSSVTIFWLFWENDAVCREIINYITSWFFFPSMRIFINIEYKEMWEKLLNLFLWLGFQIVPDLAISGPRLSGLSKPILILELNLRTKWYLLTLLTGYQQKSRYDLRCVLPTDRSKHSFSSKTYCKFFLNYLIFVVNPHLCCQRGPQ